MGDTICLLFAGVTPMHRLSAGVGSTAPENDKESEEIITLMKLRYEEEFPYLKRAPEEQIILSTWAISTCVQCTSK